MTDNTLKPCPFCGGKASTFTPPICLGDDDADVDWINVICQKCGVSKGFSRFRNHDRRSSDFLRAEAEAIAAWNTRAEASSAEPVAWMYRRDGRNVILRERLHRDGVLQGVTGWTETPLYAHPSALTKLTEALK